MNEELRALGDEFWEYQLETSPTQALMLGDHRYDERFESASRKAEDAHIARLREFADRAEGIDPATLTDDEQVSRDVLIFSARMEAATDETRPAEFAVNPAIGFHTMLPVLPPNLPIEEPEHADALVKKYEEIGRFIRENTERLREGVANGRTPPVLHVEMVVEQLDEHLSTNLDEDPMLNVRVPEAFDESATAAWKDRLKDAIDRHVRPAFSEQRDVLEQEVGPVARSMDRPGLVSLPDGEVMYGRLVHRHTTLPMDPREVHQIGLNQIEKLTDEYRALGAEVLDTTDLDEIFARLRNDPTLHFENGPDIVEASETAMAKAKAEMGNWFGRLPVADCIVQETPSGPTAFYFRPAADGSRPGIFYVNTADPARWGRYEIEAMAYHEGIPGHHLQLAIAQELEDVPEFRKHAHITAYAEGWGLYTERLADEMGLYGSQLERIGMLSADSMRAGRLVVDTGLHAMGWSRQDAIDYFAQNSPMSIGTITGEVDRYIGMPGQALAYMIGRLEIMRLRGEAKQRLGQDFDIRGFHDVVLGSGLVPLETLGRMVRGWAAA
ncbi:MAG: DUF885 domain-containing protein [Acidimicrobiia bacterium]|nr:DUF885 domain-containing protein [Acidimicrobiia bacterium]